MRARILSTIASPGSTVIGDTVVGGTVGSVLFVGAGGALAQDNANFFWDDTNNRLGIGNVSPNHRLTIGNDTVTQTSGTFVIKQASTSDGFTTQASSNDAYLRFYHSGTASVLDSNYQTSAGYTPLSFFTGNTQRLSIRANGGFTFENTVTAGGTTGNQTIDKASGTVNFAAGATAITVTNAQCSSTSIIFTSVRTNDATALIKNVVPASGSFVITLNAAATAETSVGFLIIN